MKKIKLTQNKYALVDDEDFDFLNQWKWSIRANKYAGRYEGQKHIYMHKLINETSAGFDTDHVDRNPLNNQRNNLRTITHQKNAFNAKLSSKNTSGFKGVVWSKRREKWQAQIMLNGKNKFLGFFSDIKRAGLARQLAELKYHTI